MTSQEITRVLITRRNGVDHAVKRLRAEDGQGLVEYALILLFVAVVSVAVIQFLGPEISQELSIIGASL